MSNPLAAGYSKKGRRESSPRPFCFFLMARPLPQIVAGKAPRVALLKEMSARDLTAIFTAVIAEDASLLDGVQAAHPLLWTGFGIERTPFAQLDLLLGNHLPAAYGTGQWFRFCVLLSQLHRLPDRFGRAGNGLCVRVRFLLPFWQVHLCGDPICRRGRQMHPLDSGLCAASCQAKCQCKKKHHSSHSHPPFSHLHFITDLPPSQHPVLFSYTIDTFPVLRYNDCAKLFQSEQFLGQAKGEGRWTR